MPLATRELANTQQQGRPSGGQLTLSVNIMRCAIYTGPRRQSLRGDDMPQLDPSIILRAGQPVQQMSLGELMQQRQQIMLGQRQLQALDAQERATRSANEQQASRRAAFRDSFGADGQLDRQGYARRLGELGDPDAYFGAQEQLSKADQEQYKAREALAKADDQQLSVIKARSQLTAQLIASARDQASYDRAVQMAAGYGLDVSQLPQQFSPEFRNQMLDQQLSADQMIDNELAARKQRADESQFSQTLAANNANQAASRAVTMRGQDIGAATTRRGQDMADARAQDAQRSGYGSVPQGYRMVGGRLEPIPGGPAEQAADAKKNRLSGEITRAQGLIQQANQASAQVGVGTSGFGSGALAGIRGTDAANLEAQLDTLKSNLGFAELAAMRAASPTGGALGQVTERELAFLQSTVASLDTRQSPAKLRAGLAKVANHYARWSVAAQGVNPDSEQGRKQVQALQRSGVQGNTQSQPTTKSNKSLEAAKQKWGLE